MPAFPYSQASPPPTAGPLPVIERANLNTPYSGGGGGGGGGGGPDIALSSLTMNPEAPSKIELQYQGAFGQSAVLQVDHNSTATIYTNLQSNPLFGTNANVVSFVEPGGYFDTIQVDGIGFNGQSAGIAASTNRIFVPNIGNDLRIQAQNGLTTTNTPFLSTAALVVSSINGAAPGGGGGGGPPPAATSTILALTNLSSINDGTPQLLLVAGDVGITGGYLAASAISTNQISPLQGAELSISTIGGTQTILQMSGDSGGYVLLDAGQSEGTITLKAYSTIITNDLNVSSINGAAPGGGGSVPPDLSLSTLTFNSTSGVIKFLSDKLPSGQLAFGLYTGEINNLSTITGGVLIDGTGNFEALPLYADGVFLNGPTSYTSSVMGSIRGGGPINSIQGSLIADCRGLYVTNTAGAPNTNLFASTIECSTINGAPVAALKFSTLFSGTSTLNNDPGTAIIFGFSTTIGHTYEIQTQMNIQGFGGQDGTDNDDVVQELVNELTLNTTQGSFISTCEAASRQLNIGTSGMWKASLSNQSLALSGTFSTQAILTRVALIDFGAI